MAAVGIQLGNAPAQFGGVAVALGDENRAGARQVRRRLAQGAARQQMLVAERLLAVNQHDVVPPPAQIPVLKAVVQQQRVAAEFFNRVTPALDAVLVHQHDHVLEIGREHVRLVAGHLGIEQQRFAVGHHARRGGVVAEEELVQQPLVERRRLGAVAAREDGDVAALVAQFAGELFDDRRFAGAADGQVADGDDLHAERRVAQDADSCKESARVLMATSKTFRAGVEQGPHERLARPAPLLDDDLPEGRSPVFLSTHEASHASASQCAKALETGQAEGGRAARTILGLCLAHNRPLLWIGWLAARVAAAIAARTLSLAGLGP